MSSLIERFQGMLERGTDNALLRFSLGQAHANEGHHAEAIEHLEAAVAHDPMYSAAWKLLGRSYAEDRRLDSAIQAYENGINVAQRRGDKQAAKEMQVFLRRARKAHVTGS